MRFEVYVVRYYLKNASKILIRVVSDPMRFLKLVFKLWSSGVSVLLDQLIVIVCCINVGMMYFTLLSINSPNCFQICALFFLAKRKWFPSRLKINLDLIFAHFSTVLLTYLIWCAIKFSNCYEKTCLISTFGKRL